MESLSIPSFECQISISGEIMIDPVIDPEGNTYERSAIENWLNRNPISPVTRSPLTIEQLIPNRSLRNAINEYLEINQIELNINNINIKVNIASLKFEYINETFKEVLCNKMKLGKFLLWKEKYYMRKLSRF